MTQTATTSRPPDPEPKRADNGAGERPSSSAATSKPAGDEEMRCTLCGLSACWT